MMLRFHLVAPEIVSEVARCHRVRLTRFFSRSIARHSCHLIYLE
jgi:hypothetical protein